MQYGRFSVHHLFKCRLIKVEWGVSGSEVLLKDLWNDFVERFGGELEDDIDEEDDDEDAD
jgi:hypothetical protein